MPGDAPGRGWGRRLWPAAAIPLLSALWIGFLGDDLAARTLLGAGRWSFTRESLAPHGGEFYRPLGVLWLQLEWLVTGGNPVLLHALHLVLFGVAAWQTGRLARRLGLSIPWEAVAALALAWPGRLEAAVWLLGGFDLQALVLVQAGMLAFLGERRRWTLPVLAALGFLAPAAKEVGYGLPVVLSLWWLAGIGRSPGSPARLVSAWAGAAAAVVLRLAAFGGIGGYEGTSLAGAAGRLSLVPGVLAKALFWPVNPGMGAWSLLAGAACAVAGASALGAALAGPRRPGIPRVLAAGTVVFVVFLLPAVAYLNPNVTWYHSRYLALPGVGLVLAAAGALESAGRRWKIVLGALLVAWFLGSSVNVVPWTRAARARDAILSGIERVTRGPGPHTVWLDGPIGHLGGVHLVGGFLPFLLREELPDREIHSDSRFLQRLQGRPQGPPERWEGTLHVLRFDPTRPLLEEVKRTAGGG